MIAAAGSASGDDAALVGVLEGAVKGATGDAAGQLAKIDAALASAGEGPLKVALTEQKASALASAGKSAEAAAAWKTVADATKTTFGKAHALIRIGDLHNAATGAAKTDAAKAKASYEQAIAALKEKGKAPEKGPLAFLHAEAAAKLASL